MSHHSLGARTSLLISPLVALIGVLGCSSAPQYPTERPIEIRLEQPGMTADLDALRAQYANAYLGPLHTHQRRAICSRPPAPPARGCVAQVTIQAIGESKDISPDKPIKEQYRVIARIRNLDPEDVTEMYSLKPVSQAEYLVVIDNGPNGRPRWNLVELPVGPRGVITRTPGRNLARCPGVPPHRPYPYSDVNFAECNEHAVPPVRRAGLVSSGEIGSLLTRFVSLFRPAPLIAEPPAPLRAEPGEWYGCPTGCCT